MKNKRHKWVTEKSARHRGCRKQECSACGQIRREQIEETITVSATRGSYSKKKV